MATVSGSLLYDNARTNSATGLPGIANTPIVLESVDTGRRLAVLTASNGNYTFTNVPNGNYQIVEAYGDTGPISATGNFGAEAAVGVNAIAITPPISFIANPPVGATNLDCVTRNTIPITVAGSNITGRNILNGPVKYTPKVIDSSVSTDWSNNLIGAASAGTFGLFPAGTAGMTGANPNPYPGVNKGFIYILPAAGAARPSDGYFTIQNIANNISYQVNGSWWRIADHTTGNETGRMMIVNGANDGASFFEDTVTVTPNTYYLFITRILNLIKITGRVDPQLGVIITAPDGTILYNKSLGDVIPVNLNVPEWCSDGVLINSGNYESLDVQFISLGAAASGNDYAIDDVGFYEVDIDLPKLIKSTSKTTAVTGETIDFTVSFSNNADSVMTGISFIDHMPDGLEFVPESVIINGINCLECDPSSGFDLPDLVSGDNMIITFKAIVDHVPSSGVATNVASLQYNIVLVEVAPSTTFEIQSNLVDIALVAKADIYVQKTGPSVIQNGTLLTYNLTVGNNGPDSADNIILSDVVPPEVALPQYSTDGGATWNMWLGFYNMGNMTPGQAVDLIIRGIVSAQSGVDITNTANVVSDAYDPNVDNNTSVFISNVIPAETSADLYVKKTGSESVRGGDNVTYSITVGNNGPDVAVDVILFDILPAELSSPQYSIDNGSTWSIWTGMISLGDLEKNQIVIILIRGIAENPKTVTIITNTVNVIASTSDPNPDNNTSEFSSTLTPKGSKNQAITDLIQSVALQEAALAHIINAEGEKMQRIIAMDNVNSDELMDLNRSVTRLISVILRLEMLFISKLEIFEE